jgi:outer membrane protein TolC
VFAPSSPRRHDRARRLHDASSTPAANGSAAGDAANVVAPDWWTAFGDPQLDALVNEALAEQPRR